MKVLVLGSNPSIRSPDSSAFNPATYSGQRIREWFEPFTDIEFIFANVLDKTTPCNRALNRKEIEQSVPSILAKAEGCAGIITLGNSASLAVSGAKVKIPVLGLPHPSGRTRHWNISTHREERQELLANFLESLEFGNDPV